MFLTHKYLKKCLSARDFWLSKDTKLGDLFIDIDREIIDVVNFDRLEEIQFSNPRYVFVPSVEDALELIRNQVEARQLEFEDCNLRITFEDRYWRVLIEWGEITTFGQGDSIHEALLAAWTQMPLGLEALIEEWKRGI